MENSTDQGSKRAWVLHQCVCVGVWTSERGDVGASEQTSGRRRQRRRLAGPVASKGLCRACISLPCSSCLQNVNSSMPSHAPPVAVDSKQLAGSHAMSEPPSRGQGFADLIQSAGRRTSPKCLKTGVSIGPCGTWPMRVTARLWRPKQRLSVVASQRREDQAQAPVSEMTALSVPYLFPPLGQSPRRVSPGWASPTPRGRAPLLASQ